MSCPRAVAAIRPGPSGELCHIRQGFRARWHDLSCVVESSAQQWTARVQDSGTTLYTAHRSSANAAQAAAMEFAMFQVMGEARENPERLAGRIEWMPYW